VLGPALEAALEISMLTKPLLLVILAACAAPSGAAADSNSSPERDPPKFAPPDEPPQEDQHFCCGTVDPKTWTGDDCWLISKENLVLCSSILYCPGKWTKEDGHVTCA
jgi:hypothetical protein